MGKIKYQEILIPDSRGLITTRPDERRDMYAKTLIAVMKYRYGAGRRAIAENGSYRPFNPHHMAGVASFTCPAWAVWWIPWQELVIEWVKANKPRTEATWSTCAMANETGRRSMDARLRESH